jgi:hypothetical protein
MNMAVACDLLAVFGGLQSLGLPPIEMLNVFSQALSEALKRLVQLTPLAVRQVSPDLR